LCCLDSCIELAACCELLVFIDVPSVAFGGMMKLCCCLSLLLQAALLAGRTNKALVGREEFSAAVLRSVAGIEKKRSILQGMEKEVVARHEVRAALLGRCLVLCRLCTCHCWTAAQRLCRSLP
jgi:hypothetical protein